MQNPKGPTHVLSIILLNECEGSTHACGFWPNLISFLNVHCGLLLFKYAFTIVYCLLQVIMSMMDVSCLFPPALTLWPFLFHHCLFSTSMPWSAQPLLYWKDRWGCCCLQSLDSCRHLLIALRKYWKILRKWLKVAQELLDNEKSYSYAEIWLH